MVCCHLLSNFKLANQCYIMFLDIYMFDERKTTINTKFSTVVTLLKEKGKQMGGVDFSLFVIFYYLKQIWQNINIYLIEAMIT